MNSNRLDLISKINHKAHQIITEEAYYNKEKNKIEQRAELGGWGNKIDSEDKKHIKDLKKVYENNTKLLKSMIHNLLILYEV